MQFKLSYKNFADEEQEQIITAEDNRAAIDKVVELLVDNDFKELKFKKMEEYVNEES